MARAAFVLGLIPGVAARWFGLYSVCATDATCNLSKCENSTLYLNRCEYVGGPGMMSTMNICNQTSREFVTLEYADSPNCAGEEHPNAVSLASCLTGPFGGHTEFNCGTVPYVPAPPPGAYTARSFLPTRATCPATTQTRSSGSGLLLAPARPRGHLRPRLSTAI